MSKLESEIRFPFDEAFIEPAAKEAVRQKILTFIQKFPPEQLYLSKDVLNGREHSFRHNATLLIYINYFGPSAETFAKVHGLDFNFRAQEITGFFHDSQRSDDGEDYDHAKRAADLLASLNMSGQFNENADTMSTAIKVCSQHNAHPNHFEQNLNLGFFRRLDALAWVRYESNINASDTPGFGSVTTDFLDTIYPGVSPRHIARGHIVMARFMQIRIDTMMQEQKVVEADFAKILDICLDAGLAAGFLQ